MGKKGKKPHAKLGRNDPCWCGSGRKYKHCHLHRAQEVPVSVQELAQRMKKTFSKGYCLHPQASPQTCSGNIVKAHTIQRSGGLSRIAQDGHVYGFDTDFPAGIDKDGQVKVKRIGIKLASTFTGFCGFHDNQTFEPIEKGPFQSSQQHAFLLGYRTLCNVLFVKKAKAELMPSMRSLDRGTHPIAQRQMQEHFDYVQSGLTAGLNDIEHHKTAYDNALLQTDYSAVSYYVIRLGAAPDFLCSGATQPEYDFEGRLLQDLANLTRIADFVTFSLIATDSGGAAVFAWLGESEPAAALVRSLQKMPDEQVPHALVRFTFEYFENVFMSPNWWDRLDEASRSEIVHRFRPTPYTDRGANILVDDGLRAVSWIVASRETNIAL